MSVIRSGSGRADDTVEATGRSRPGHGVARATGLLLMVATAAVVAADAVEPEFADMAGNHDRLAIALLLRILAAGASVGIAISLYPLLRKVDQTLATGSVVFRTIEAVMYLAGVVVALTLVPLSEQSATATEGRAADVRLMVDTLATARHSAGLIAVFAFAAGAFMYYWVLHRATLVPRWLSAWGLLAVLMIFTACLLSLYRSTPVSDYIVLAAPIFLQEIVLGVWLLTRGFNPAPEAVTVASKHVAPGSD